MTARHACRFACILLAAVVSVHSLASVALAQLRAEVYVTGLASPVAFAQDPSNANLQYVVEQGGRIRVVNRGVLAPGDFLNLASLISCCGERGLLGLAFPPDYATSGRFYVSFTNSDGNLVVARFERSANPLVADPNTRFDFLWPGGHRYIAHSGASNHNGGTVAFGPDGYLYYGVGDGGGANDKAHNAQNPNVLLGKMLRLDVNVPDSHVEGYVVPPDNPFVDGVPAVALHEIWAFGLRNPWKFSFDNPAGGGTGALVIGDVGQNAWEEIDYQPAGLGGRNYGWRNREGAHDNVTNLGPAYLPLTDPIFEYNHPVGRAITGGYIYRGMSLSAYNGRYFFADLSGKVWSIALTIDDRGEATASNAIDHTTELGGAATLGFISAFGEDGRGELYILSYTLGRVLRISPPRAQLTSSTLFPATWGSPITWTATSSSGIPPLQYQFWRLKQNVGWVLAQDYSPNNTYTWTPGPSEGGSYLLQVWVRGAGSQVAYETWGPTPSFEILGAPPLSITGFGANRTFPSPAHVPITWTTVTSGGSPPLQYQFWRLKQGTGWSLVQDYSAVNTYSWTPTAGDMGTYVLQVWVRSTGSTAAYDTWSGTGNFVITGLVPVQITSFGSSVALPVTVGTPITWSASAIGGTPPIQFKFYVLDVSAGVWSLRQDSTVSSMTWTPLAAGSYVVQVWARSSTSAAPYDDWRGTGYFSILPSGGLRPVYAPHRADFLTMVLADSIAELQDFAAYSERSSEKRAAIRAAHVAAGMTRYAMNTCQDGADELSNPAHLVPYLQELIADGLGPILLVGLEDAPKMQEKYKDMGLLTSRVRDAVRVWAPFTTEVWLGVEVNEYWADDQVQEVARAVRSEFNGPIAVHYGQGRLGGDWEVMKAAGVTHFAFQSTHPSVEDVGQGFLADPDKITDELKAVVAAVKGHVKVLAAEYAYFGRDPSPAAVAFISPRGYTLGEKALEVEGIDGISNGGPGYWPQEEFVPIETGQRSMR